MTLTPKEELHRLIDEIPDDDTYQGRLMLAIGRAVAQHDLSKQNPRFQRFIEDIAYLHAHAESPDALSSGLEVLQRRWMSGEDRPVPPLPKILAEAPEDDEPLTSEEIELLDRRLLEARIKPTIPHDEVLRRLRS